MRYFHAVTKRALHALSFNEHRNQTLSQARGEKR